MIRLKSAKNATKKSENIPDFQRKSTRRDLTDGKARKIPVAVDGRDLTCQRAAAMILANASEGVIGGSCDRNKRRRAVYSPCSLRSCR